MSDRSNKAVKEIEKYGVRTHSRRSNKSQTSAIKRGNASAMSSKTPKKWIARARSASGKRHGSEQRGGKNRFQSFSPHLKPRFVNVVNIGDDEHRGSLNYVARKRELEKQIDCNILMLRAIHYAKPAIKKVDHDKHFRKTEQLRRIMSDGFRRQEIYHAVRGEQFRKDPLYQRIQDKKKMVAKLNKSQFLEFRRNSRARDMKATCRAKRHGASVMEPSAADYQYHSVRSDQENPPEITEPTADDAQHMASVQEMPTSADLAPSAHEDVSRKDYKSHSPVRKYSQGSECDAQDPAPKAQNRYKKGDEKQLKTKLAKKNGQKLKARHESQNRSNPRYLSRSIDQEVCFLKIPKSRGANQTMVARRNPMKVPLKSGKMGSSSKPTSTISVN